MEERIESIPDRSDAELKEALNEEPFLIRAKAICEVVRRHLDDPETVHALRTLQEDPPLFLVSVFDSEFCGCGVGPSER